MAVVASQSLVVLMARNRPHRATALPIVCTLLVAFLSIPASAGHDRDCHRPRIVFSFRNLARSVEQLTLVGDAAVGDDGLEISGSQPQSVGGLFFSQPLRLRLPFGPKPSLSFSSIFSFSMDANQGDGLAFVIAPSKDFKGMNGPWLGLSPSSEGTAVSDLPLSHTFAIEFDTSMDAEVQDPSGNHVGLDIESLVSLATADVSDGLSLNNGKMLYAWVDYIAPLNLIEVRLSQASNQRPKAAILSHTIDLSSLWKDEMYVGFSSSTGNSPQRHIIYSWSFFTKGPKRYRPKWFGPHWHHKENGDLDWHYGPKDWHHGPHDWQRVPQDWFQHGSSFWARENGPHGPGFPNWGKHSYPFDWHHHPHHHDNEDDGPRSDHPRHHHHDDDNTWLDGPSDVWNIVWALLFGAVCGTFAAGIILVIWSFVQRCFMGKRMENADGGLIYGYQTTAGHETGVVYDANGYQKIPVAEPGEKA